MGGDDELTFGQKASIQWAGFKKFVWNKEEGTFMSRGGKSWGQLLLFYSVFYLCLAAFWAGLLAVFLQTIDPSRPTWTSYVSRPGLSYIPNAKHNRIQFDPSNEKSYKGFVKKLEDVVLFLEGKENSQKKTGPDQDGEGFVDCPAEPNKEPTEVFCRYPVSMLGECQGGSFGYDVMQPCIFLNLNKIWGWTPTNFGDDSEDGGEPEDAPDDFEGQPNYIAIKCTEKEESDDYEQAISNITISPSNGISFGHFPYEMTTDKSLQNKYLVPYVSIKVGFEGDFYNKDIRMTCMAISGNIQPIKGIYESEAKPEFEVTFHVEKK